MRIIPLLLALVIASSVSFGQDKKFSEGFNTAKLHLANHKIESALPVLEELYEMDKSNANINYLLGLCYVKTETNLPKAIEVLEFSSKYFAKDYDASSFIERRSPEYVYYYLLIAYSMNLQCKEALETLNQFYNIYSYEDEYYLIDGQKWVRECHMKDPEEEKPEEPALAQAETKPPPPPPAPPKAEEKPKEEPKVVEPVKEAPEVVEAMAEVKPEPAPKPEPPKPVFKDRLVRVDADFKKEIGTKTIDYSTFRSLYGVQVGAFLSPKFTRELQGLKNVEVYIDQNGVFRYVIGRFTFKSQAEKLMAHVQRAGYKDAFIVDVNNQKYSEEVIYIEQESIKGEFVGKVDFKVQIGAFRHQIPDSLASIYLQIDNIKEYTHQDLTILTVGSFSSYQQAATQRDRVKATFIKDAFVVAYNSGRKIGLNEAKKYLENQRAEDAADAAAEEANGKKKKQPKEKPEKENKEKKEKTKAEKPAKGSKKKGKKPEESINL